MDVGSCLTMLLDFWDDKIPEEELKRWENWLEELPTLEQFCVERSVFQTTQFRGVTCGDQGRLKRTHDGNGNSSKLALKKTSSAS